MRRRRSRRRRRRTTPRRERRRTTRPTAEGRHAPVRELAATGTRWTPRDTYYAYSWDFIRLYGRTLVMFKSGAGQGRRHSSCPTSPSRWACPATTPRPGPTRCATGSSSRTARRSRARTSSTRSSVAGQDDVPQRPDLLQRLPRPAGLHHALQGPVAGQAGSEGDRDAGRPDDRLPAEAAVLGLRLLRAAAVDDPGAAAKDTGASTRSTWSPPARTCSTATSSARASRWCATPTGTRRPTRTARRCRTASRSRSTSTPTTSTTGCMAGDLDVDIEGTGVQPAAQGKILADPTLKANADSAVVARATGTPRSTATSRRWTTSTAARRSMYAADKTGYQTRLRRRRRRRHRDATCCRR